MQYRLAILVIALAIFATPLSLSASQQKFSRETATVITLLRQLDDENTQHFADLLETGEAKVFERPLPHGAFAFGIVLEGDRQVPYLYVGSSPAALTAEPMVLLGLYHEVQHYRQYRRQLAAGTLILDEWINNEDVFAEDEARRNFIGELEAFHRSAEFAIKAGWDDFHPSISLFRQGGPAALANGFATKAAHDERYTIIGSDGTTYHPTVGQLLIWTED